MDRSHTHKHAHTPTVTCTASHGKALRCWAQGDLEIKVTPGAPSPALPQQRPVPCVGQTICEAKQSQKVPEVAGTASTKARMLNFGVEQTKTLLFFLAVPVELVATFHETLLAIGEKIDHVCDAHLVQTLTTMRYNPVGPRTFSIITPKL